MTPPSAPGMLNIGPGHYVNSSDLFGVFPTDGMCALPYFWGSQDRYSQMCLYLFFLRCPINFSQRWETTVQMFNYLFHRTCGWTIPKLNTVLEARKLEEPPATEEGVRQLFETQTLFPTDERGMIARYKQLEGNGKCFQDWSPIITCTWTLHNVLFMMLGWADDAGIKLLIEG